MNFFIIIIFYFFFFIFIYFFIFLLLLIVLFCQNELRHETWNQIDFFNIWQNTIFMTVYLFIQPSNIERININCFTKFLSLDQLKIIQSHTFPKVLLLSTITALCEANSTANTKCTPAYIIAIAITLFLIFHSIYHFITHSFHH